MTGERQRREHRELRGIRGHTSEIRAIRKIRGSRSLLVSDLKKTLVAAERSEVALGNQWSHFRGQTSTAN